LRDRRWDLLDLLLDAGRDPKTVDPDDVFSAYSREVMERFWALGADLAGDGALADALAHQTSNRPLYGFVKNHTDDPRIQREADMGLGCAIARKNDKAVNLCLWAGANPRNSVPMLGSGHEPSEGWTMTAFERAVRERSSQYLGKLGFDPASDDIEPLYDLAYHASDVEALTKFRPPKDWHPIAEGFLDRALLFADLETGAWGARWDLERVFQLGGRLRTLSSVTARRLRKHLKGLARDEGKRWLRLLAQHSDRAAFLGLIGHPMFIESYRDWRIKKELIEDLAAGRGGSKAGTAMARKVLKAEGASPPQVQVPRRTDRYTRVTREQLYEIIWSTPMVIAAKQYGLSDNGLRKKCKQLDVPTPPRGYWAGRRPRRRARLAAPKDGWPTEAWLPRPGPTAAGSDSPTVVGG
jgi:hypothetical protein